MRALLMAGYLKDCRELKEALRAALPLIVQDADVCKPMQGLLGEQHTVPSSATLYRRRLSFQAGFCRWPSDRNAEMMHGRGCCRWGTMDSSPQGAFDWLLSGSACVRNDDLPAALVEANRLIELRQEDSEDARDQQQRLVASLGPKLMLLPGTPTGIGSGKAGLRCQMHAYIHSQRLAHARWPVAIRAISETFTFTGDL